jgi:hypothetical protein
MAIAVAPASAGTRPSASAATGVRSSSVSAGASEAGDGPTSGAAGPPPASGDAGGPDGAGHADGPDGSAGLDGPDEPDDWDPGSGPVSVLGACLLTHSRHHSSRMPGTLVRLPRATV